MRCKGCIVVAALIELYLPVPWVSGKCWKQCHTSQTVDTLLHARDEVRIATCYGVQLKKVDAEALWAILIVGEQTMCRLFGSCGFDDHFEKFSVYLCRCIFSVCEPWSVQDGVLRPDLVVEKVNLVLGHAYLPEVPIPHAFKFRKHLRIWTTVLLGPSE